MPWRTIVCYTAVFLAGACTGTGWAVVWYLPRRMFSLTARLLELGLLEWGPQSLDDDAWIAAGLTEEEARA